MANTPNYGLYKPDRADTTVEVDTSLANNFTTIDTKIKANEDGLASHESSTTAHDSANITHSSGSVKDELDSLDTRVTDIETNGVSGGTIPDDLNNRLTNVETTNDTQDNRITDVENNVNGMLAPTTFDELANQTFDYDTLRFGYVDNKLTPINTELDDHASQLADIVTLAPAPNGVDDTTALQNVFAGGNKKIQFSHDGQYIISSTINLFSNTTVEVKGNVTFFLKANSPCYMFIAEGSSFQNIKWTGGIIDGNDTNQGTETGANYDTCKGMVFKNVTNLSVQGVTVKNVRGHSINHWNCNGVIFKDIQFSQGLSTLVPNGGSRRDGITGSSNNVLIDNISGFTDDDLVAILAGVDWAGTNTTPINVSNIEVRNIKAQKHSSGRDPWRGTAIYASGGYSITNIKVDGVYGDFNDALIYMGNYGKPTRGSIIKPIITNVYGEATYDSGSSDNGMIRIVDTTIDTLILKDVLAKLTVADNTKKHLIRTTDADITKLILNNVVFNISIVLTSFIALLNEYTAGTHNISEVQMQNICMVLSASYTNAYLYYKNNGTTVQTTLYANNISVPAPTYSNNGTTISDNQAVLYCANASKIFMTNNKLPVLNSTTLCKDGDTILDSQLGELVYSGGKFYVNKPVGVVTSTTYLTFDATTSYIIVDGSSNSTFFRIQDLADGSIKANFKNGFTVKVKRIDNNVNSHPYVKMTSGQLIDGTDSLYLNPFQTITLQYWNGSWVNVTGSSGNTYGTDSISSGTTSKTVTHGMGGTPSYVNANAQGNVGSIWITNITSTQFTINCGTAPGTTTTVNWHARL